MSSRGPRAVVMGAAPVPVAGSLSNSARQVPPAPWLISRPAALAGVPATVPLEVKLAVKVAE
ncbi:hypothetical protein [Thermostichus sp. MS-CIW-25]